MICLLFERVAGRHVGHDVIVMTDVFKRRA